MAKIPASFSNPPDWLVLVTWSVILPLALLSLVENIAVLYAYARDRLPCREKMFFVLNIASCDFILCSVTMPAYITLMLSKSNQYIGNTRCILIIVLSYISTDTVICIIFFYIIDCYRLIYFGNIPSLHKEVSKAYIKTGALISWVIIVIMNVVMIDNAMAYEDFCYNGLPASMQGHQSFIIVILTLVLIGTAVCSYPLVRTGKALIVLPANPFTRRRRSNNLSDENIHLGNSSQSCMAEFLQNVKHPPLVTFDYITIYKPLHYFRSNLEWIMEAPMDERKAEKENMRKGSRKKSSSISTDKTFEGDSIIGPSRTTTGTGKSRGSLLSSGVSSGLYSKDSSHLLELLVSAEGRDVVDGIPLELLRRSFDACSKKMDGVWSTCQSITDVTENTPTCISCAVKLKPSSSTIAKVLGVSTFESSFEKPPNTAENVPGNEDTECDGSVEIMEAEGQEKRPLLNYSTTIDSECQSSEIDSFPLGEIRFEAWRDKETHTSSPRVNDQAKTRNSDEQSPDKGETTPNCEDQQYTEHKRRPGRLRRFRLRRFRLSTKRKVFPATISPTHAVSTITSSEDRLLTQKIKHQQSDIETGRTFTRKKYHRHSKIANSLRNMNRKNKPIPNKSIVCFRHAFLVVLITTLTWLPFLVYVFVHSSLRHNKSELYASPFHAFLHVLAWSRPCLTGIVHLAWIKRNNEGMK